MAFSPQTKGKHPWANKKSNKFPVVVWSKLPGKVTIAKFSFASRSDGYTFQSPTVFELVGSEDCERWKVIDKFSTKFTKKNEVKTWYIPKNKRKSFSCIGIKVHKVTKGPYAAIQNLKMWKEPAKPAAKPGDCLSTYFALPFFQTPLRTLYYCCVMKPYFEKKKLPFFSKFYKKQLNNNQCSN